MSLRRMRLQSEQNKFSPMGYISGRRLQIMQLSHAPFAKEAHDDGKVSRMEHGQFQDLVEDIRSVLINIRGKSEADQRHYSEVLNRAILGFPAEREHLLAIIHDELLKRRVEGWRPPHGKYETLADALFAEIIGLHVLELIMKKRDDLEEVQVTGTQIFEIREGQTVPSSYQFDSVKEVERIQQNLVLFNNDVLSPRKPWAEVMLVDGSRVTMTGFGFTSEPTLTIRFYPLKEYSLASLCRPEFGTINDDMRKLLQIMIRSYLNMVIIGPTNSGKTHLMKAMIAEMPDHERIVTIEPRLELMLKRDFPHKNVVEFEADESDEIRSQNRAFKLALRQSPRRICHAEIRDHDANVYVRACTRGHDGSLTSVHVNTLEDVPDAITDMCMLDRRGMNPERLRKRIVEYVAQIGIEMAIIGNKRKAIRIAEFTYVDGHVCANDLFIYDFAKNDWKVSGAFSDRNAEKIKRFDPQGYAWLNEMGWLQPCSR